MRVFNQETRKKPEYCVIIVESFEEAIILHAVMEAYLLAHKRNKKVWAINEALSELATTLA